MRINGLEVPQNKATQERPEILKPLPTYLHAALTNVLLTGSGFFSV